MMIIVKFRMIAFGCLDKSENSYQIVSCRIKIVFSSSRVRRMVLIAYTRVAFASALVLACWLGVARADTVLARIGTWQLVRMEPSFDLTIEACVVVSTSKISGGRSEISEVRIIPALQKIFIDPDIFLSGVVTALAVIEHRSDRQIPQRRILHHSLKIDDGSTLEASEANPSYGKWEVSRSFGNFQDFITRLGKGRFLHYQWKLDRAGKYHRYDLTGLGTLLEKAKQSSDCKTGR